MHIPSPTPLPVAWNDNNEEENLQRIITQKWIANYPLGLEAWAEYRRTGYPELYPCIDNLSPSGVDSKRGMRRLRFPYTEVQNNHSNYQQDVSYLKMVIRIMKPQICRGEKLINITS